jgi:hypothetical protein
MLSGMRMPLHDAAGTSGWPGWLARGLVLCGLATIPFLPSISAERLWDDPHYVFENPPVADRERGLARIWAGEFLMDYYPVAQTAIWAEYGLFGDDARGFRLANIFWHAVGGCAAWWAARAWRLPGAWWLAALWAVHPTNVDAVAWISQHKATIAAVFFMLAAGAFAHGLEAAHEARGAYGLDGRRLGWYALALACHVAGCLSKTDAVMLPPLLTILEVWWWPLVTADSRTLAARLPAIARRQLPFYAVSAGAAVVAMKFMRERTLQSPLDLGPPLDRVLDACWAVCFYLADVVWPANLAATYPVGDLPAGEATSWLWPALLVGLCAIAWAARRYDRGAAMAALAAFTILLVPVLFIVPQGFFQYSLVADRYLHLPLLAPAAVAAAALTLWADAARRRGCGAASLLPGALLIMTLAAVTWRHAADYRDERALWSAAMAAQPRAWYPHFGLGAHLLWDRHDAAAAIPPLTESCRRKPDFAKGHFVAGLAVTPTRPADARRHLADAIAVEPEYVMAWLALGECCVRLNDLDGATQVYAHAARWANATRRAKTELLRLALASRPRAAVVAAARDLAQASQALASPRHAGVEGLAGDAFEQALAEAMFRLVNAGDGGTQAFDQAGFVRAIAGARSVAGSPLDVARAEAWAEPKTWAGLETLPTAIAAAAAGRLATLAASHPRERTVAQDLAIARRISGSDAVNSAATPDSEAGPGADQDVKN